MDVSFKKRDCLVRSYFFEDSFAFQFFSSKNIAFVKLLLIAIFLGSSLVISIISWGFSIMVVLFIDIFILYWLYFGLLKLLSTSVKEPVKYVITKDLSVFINTFILVIAILIIEYYSPIPTYLSDSLKSTLDLAYDSYTSECKLTHFLLKLNIEKEAASWWTMLYANQQIENQNLKLLAWVVFLLSHGLVAYAYSRYIIQLIDFGRVFGGKNDN